MGIMSFLFAIIGLIIFLKLIALPFKLIFRFIINSIIGGIVLWILAFFGIFVVLNWWTIVLTGLLGVPGLVIAVLITMFI
jgi:inhibitor of the pro-sigma K processing machinery